MNKIKKHCAASLFHPSRHITVSRQSGMTIIEVLVSMLILGLGVLVLLATQLRTAAGVREAEQQTIVSQEVQNLIEGMLANPILSADTSSEAKGWTKKSYTAYINRSNPSGTISAGKSPMSKQALADAQINEFRQALSERMPNTHINSTICLDSSAMAPTASGTAINWNCDNSGATTMVKVIWQIATDENHSNSGITMNGDRAVYTYQARITD